MALTPTIQWSYLASNAYGSAPASGVFFDPSTGVGSWGSPPAIPTLTHGPKSWLAVGIATTGSWSTVVTGDYTAGSTTITNVSDTTGIAIGHQIVPDGLHLPLGPVPVVTAVTGDTITFADLSSPARNYLATLASGSGVAITVQSAWPLGALAFDVSPFSGVTVVDGQADGTGSANNIGQGTAVSNLGNQAEGAVTIGLLAAGSYTVSVAYTSRDPAYLSASVPSSLAFTAA